MNDQQLNQVAVLNRHPLNREARARLSALGHSPDPKLLDLLSLTHLGLVDPHGEPPDPLSPEAKALQDWSQGVSNQASAMWHLEHSLSLWDVKHANLDNVAQQVCKTLLGASRG